MENEDSSVPELLKSVTMKDVAYWISEAWSEATNDSLAKAWKQLLSESPDDSSEVSTPNDEERDDEEEMTAVLGQDLQDAVVEWLDSDCAHPGHQILDDEEIVADTLEISNNEESDEEEEIEQTKITPDSRL